MNKRMIRVPDVLLQSGKNTPPVLVVVMAAILIYLALLAVTVGGLVAYVASAISRIDFGSLGQELTSPSADAVFLIALGLTTFLTLFSIIYVKKIEQRPLGAMGIRRARFGVRYAQGYAVGAVVLALVLTPFLISWHPMYTGFAVITPAYLVVFALQGASEEVFIRGMMMPALARRVSAGWAVAISSAFFALLHFGNGAGSVLYYAELFMTGAALALLTLRTGTIWAACAAHGAWNFMAGLLVPAASTSYEGGYSIFVSPWLFGSDYPNDGLYAAIAGVWLAVALWALLIGRRRLLQRVPFEKWMAVKALRIGARIGRGRKRKDARAMAAGARELLHLEKDQAAASLSVEPANARYSIGWLKDRGFSDDVCEAVEALRKQPGESVRDYLARAAENPIARRVKAAQLRHLLATQYADPKSHSAARYQAFLREAAAMLEGGE